MKGGEVNRSVELGQRHPAKRVMDDVVVIIILSHHLGQLGDPSDLLTGHKVREVVVFVVELPRKH